MDTLKHNTNNNALPAHPRQYRLASPADIGRNSFGFLNKGSDEAEAQYQRSREVFESIPNVIYGGRNSVYAVYRELEVLGSFPASAHQHQSPMTS